MDIEKLSLEQLRDLNKRVIKRIDYPHSLKTRAHPPALADQAAWPEG